MGLFSDEISDRIVDVDGISDWKWITSDHGAFDGPSADWICSHKAAYMKHVTSWDIVVQAGGNCGMYPALFSRMFKAVYTFEPDPLNFFALVQNCQYPNVVKLQAALGESHQMVSVSRLTMDNVGMHRVAVHSDGRIPQLCIDDLELPSCGLIQLDLEGYEPAALRGAVDTIARHRPIISCENGGRVQAFLNDIGYHLVQQSKMDMLFAPN